MEVTPVGGPFTAPAPTACASCIFGAYSSKILSFTSSHIEHITVSVTPHIAVYYNGSRSTSFESNTVTKSAVVGGIAGSNSSKIFTRKADITWTVDGATLTYPTKYVQYLGFSGAPAATEDGDTCAETTGASAISLPETTDGASFIYALPANATAMALPTPLLQYLGGLDDLVEQFDGAALTGCAPLDGLINGSGSNDNVPYSSGNNGSVGFPSGYASFRPTGYIGSESSLPSHSSFRPTGYPSSSDDVESDVPSSSTSSTQGGYANGNPASGATSASSSTAAEPSEISPSSQESMSKPKFSILPHPYLNTTFSRTASHSEIATYSVPASTSADVTTDSTASASIVVTSSAALSFSMSEYPIGTGIESNSASSTATGRPGYPPKGTQPGPENNDPDDNDGSDGGFDGTSSATLAPSNPAYETVAPSSSSYGEGENVHTTAFVIEPITGPALITYEPKPTNTGDDGKGRGGGNDGGGGGGEEGHGGDHDGSDQGPGGYDDNTAPNAPGDTNPPGSNSNGHQPSNQNQPSPNADSPGSSQPSHSSPGGGGQNNGAPQNSPGQQGPDLSNLNSAINSVAEQAGGGRAQATPGPVYNAGGTKVTAQPGGAVVIGGSTVQPGGSITVGSGPSATVVELQTKGGSTHLVVGGSTAHVLSGTITAAPGAVTDVSSMALITTNGHTITAIQSGHSLILSDGSSATTVAEGKAATFAGQTIFAVASDEAVFVNGNITPLTAAEGVEGVSQAIITANGHTITALDAGHSMLLVDGSVTKTVQDGSNVMFEGQTISAQPGGMGIVVNGRTSSLTSAIALATGQAVVTAGGHTFSVLDLPGYVVLVDGTSSLTLRDGATATFEGQLISALLNGDAVLVNDHTMSMTSPVGVATAKAIITAGGHTFTALDFDGYVVLEDRTSTLTIRDGMTGVFDGQTIKALKAGDAMLVNGRTASFTSVEASATPHINEFINKGISGGESTSSPTVGAASRPTNKPDGNSASTLAAGWLGVAIAGLFGLVAML